MSNLFRVDSSIEAGLMIPSVFRDVEPDFRNLILRPLFSNQGKNKYVKHGLTQFRCYEF